MENLGLTIEDVDSIKAVFSKYSQVEKVLLYGSRAMGNYKPASDIDLTLIGTGIDLGLQTQIEFDLDDLMLPYKFDISIYDRITTPEFISHIDRVGKVFYERKGSGNKVLRKHNVG
ncbi:nucleotidyltransferase domain-containing protein [Imperialibacter roseus]|uniref:Nucleotidyltransferase domain-containing protein n=1 Tax=Imperialibacter roseus TaxID=1324217 RepID=A0ABZ0IMP5_9BACT|nr:nucleotidyltransferase domain-containing protein [Imperialibacter roseus]WOK05245.1 nucleotidyltransferase domain-containing protein [Imperialibacter roseus]